jgi:hypothetical protein
MVGETAHVLAVAAPCAFVTLAQVQTMLEATLVNLREMASVDGPSWEREL